MCTPLMDPFGDKFTFLCVSGFELYSPRQINRRNGIVAFFDMAVYSRCRYRKIVRLDGMVDVLAIFHRLGNSALCLVEAFFA